MANWPTMCGRATERLVCRLGYAERIEQLDKLWGVAPKASSTAQRWLLHRSKRRAVARPTLVPVLDIQHARQHVWETGHKLTSDKNAVGAWVAPHIRAVDEGGALGVVIDLSAVDRIDPG